MPARKPKPKPKRPKRPPAVVSTIAYTDSAGRSPFRSWFRGLSDETARAAITERLFRVREGNPGDCRPVRAGVWELRVDVGPGYRVYYAKDGLAIVLLLCGGDKRTQSADIDRAVELWQDWQTREEKP